jgi:hypothetical protein
MVGRPLGGADGDPYPSPREADGGRDPERCRTRTRHPAPGIWLISLFYQTKGITEMSGQLHRRRSDGS